MSNHISTSGARITRYSKALVALLGSLLTALIALTPVLGTGTAADVVAVVVAAGTGLSAYLVRNTQTIADLADQAETLGYSVVKK